MAKAYTDLEQSKKLAEILPLESADMIYMPMMDIDSMSNSGFFDIPECYSFNEFKDSDTKPLPCWSLAALLGVLPKGDYKDTNLCYGGLTINDYVDEWFCSYQQPEPMVMLHTHADNSIDACYEMILKLHEQNLL